MTDIHTHFSLSYANYLVLPRTLLQSMPDEWQHQFVAMIEQLDAAFENVPQAEAYKVAAAEEHEVSCMTDAQLTQAGITADWYKRVPAPGDLSPFDLAEWRAEHEDEAGPKYFSNGIEIDSDEVVLLTVPDPVPHYDRGRARITPDLDALRAAANQAVAS